MDVIPVLDLMKGHVVHGMQGARERYLHIESILTSSSAPLAVARALRKETGCTAFYIADLDAIQGTGHHNDVISELAEDLGDVDLWVDAGVTEAVAAARLLAAGAGRVIVGSETLTGLVALERIRDALPPGRLLISVDVGVDGVLSRSPELQGLGPLAACAVLVEQGFSQMILLALSQVGTGSGPDWSALEAVRGAFPHLSLIAGGGVRNPDDLRRLDGLGVAGALVATSLHHGWITGADLRAMQHDQ
jgi:phosphoribosylformimino-5-aminoimidazole carboxamide ribotide isomerase